MTAADTVEETIVFVIWMCRPPTGRPPVHGKLREAGFLGPRLAEGFESAAKTGLYRPKRTADTARDRVP